MCDERQPFFPFGNYDYRSPADGDLSIIDVADPTSPSEIGSYTDGTVGRVAVVPPFLYAASSLHDGFNILQLDILSSVPEPEASRLELYQNYPSPFNQGTMISFTLPRAMAVELSIYNVSGQLVATVVDRIMDAGPHSTSWNGTNQRGDEVRSGVYFYRLNAGGRRLTKKLVLLR